MKKALPKAGKVCLWLLKIILPISLLVRLLQYSGLLDEFSVYLEPLFSLIGLPGKTAIIFITSVFSPLYAPIALISSMSLNLREATILSLMCLTAHNLIVESSVQSKTGSSFWEMSILRFLMSFVIAFFLNWVMPKDGWSTISVGISAVECESLVDVFLLWFITSLEVVLTILLIVSGLMILHDLLEEFNLLKGLSFVFSPVMKIFGLPRDAAFLWLVGNVVGLAYGGGIMREQIERKKLTFKSGNLLNHHLAICHSLLEDTIIFVAIGIPVLWLVITRVVFAMIVVWGYRGGEYVKKRIWKKIILYNS